MYGMKIDDKHTYNDWGMKMVSMRIPLPQPKTHIISIPGTDGVLDLTESVAGRVVYGQRENAQWVFDASGNYRGWHELTSEVANYVHGQCRKIILDSDLNYYYIGRLTLDSAKSNEVRHVLTISGTLDPYKYDVASSLGDWLWDPFSFRYGVARNYKDIIIDGSRTVSVPGGSPKPIVPILIASAAMKVEVGGKTYSLSAGRNKIYDIMLGMEEVQLTFSCEGTATVTIDYRGGSL